MRLCGEFIAAWETADQDQEEAAKEPDPYGAKALRSRVEAWTRQTLLLTERPRDFSLYPLPKLTCLYRVLTAQKLKDWQSIPELPNAKSAVGDAELQRVLKDTYDWFSQEEEKLIRMTPRDAYGFLLQGFQEQTNHAAHVRSSAYHAGADIFAESAADRDVPD